MEFELESESDVIELSSLLKLAGVFESGGQIKHIIQDGLICVDGEVETRRKCKVRVGQCVTSDDFDLEIRLVSSAA